MIETPEEAGATPAPASKRTIVVVEDALLLRDVYAGYLEAGGYEVALAADGVEALLQIRRLRPHGVLLDLLMPRLNGLEILSEIRAIDPAIRVIVVTGARASMYREQVLALGARAFLEKPVPREVLLSYLGDAPPEDGPVRRPRRRPPTPPASGDAHGGC
jgi:CheY-like chemotaxis protein